MEENGTAPAAEAPEVPEMIAEAVTAPEAEQTAETAETIETAAAPETAEVTAESGTEVPAAEPEEISYHAVEKEGHVTAIWEMQGRKHLRTIDPRSSEGKQIMELYTAETHE